MGRVCERFTPFVDGVMEYYAAGHTVTETAQHFDVTRHQVNYWAKVRHVSNGRTFEQGGRECNLKRSQGLLSMPNGVNEKQIEQAKDRWSIKLSALGFELIEWRGKQSGATLKCMKCGDVFDRSSYADMCRRVNCPRCLADQRRLRTEEKLEEKREESRRKKLLREEKRKTRGLEEEQRLDAPHICEECGKVYTIRSYMASTGYKYRRNSGVCSAKCRDERTKRKQEEHSKQRGRHSEPHYDRAKRLGLPVERGVTLKKLYERDGGICQICGMVCDYSGNGLSDLYPSIDHIIPLSRDPEKVGGHTWSNVQLAHRICNSVKSARRGEEWNNGTTKAS
jgi:5-methylcytosine-specific restriction endonuclease McrA